MRIFVCAISVAMVLMLPPSMARAAARQTPSCNTQLMKRNGAEITVRLQQLTEVFNQKLRRSGSDFSDLQLTSEGHNELKVSVRQNGKTISISGPLEAASSGAIKLHANKIVRDGTNEKGLMDIFGKDLANYAHFSKTPSLSAQGNNLFIHPDPLLNVSGKVIGLSLNKSHIILKFASRPCQ